MESKIKISFSTLYRALSCRGKVVNEIFWIKMGANSRSLSPRYQKTVIHLPGGARGRHNFDTVVAINIICPYRLLLVGSACKPAIVP